jgi:hypothetical protein
MGSLSEGMTMRKSTSVSYAIALGSFVGAASALELSPENSFSPLLFIFCTLLGGLVGWVANDVKGFCAGVKMAWQKTTPIVLDAQRWRTAVLNYFAFLGLLETVSAIFIVFSRAMEYFFSPQPYPPLDSLEVLMVVAIFVTAAAFGAAVRFCEADQSETHREESEWLLRTWNPMSVFMTIVSWVATGLFKVSRGVLKTMDGTPAAMRRFGAFLSLVFITVQTDERRISFVGAIIFTIVGYKLGSAILGSVLGGLVGFWYHRLVVTRWLKLVPARA